ncbi:ATP-binding cassette domain-containing protein [Amycolatopsis acidiphila]|uniref:ATP-binding cassette domain-containing protein n=1 Tax=Amycolatopsis acidiphila TaxID=715473 RepID=A0A558AAQ8_9PSEU|nr:ATP-binding cassette domain-containing protein [Amycolatopsis acidiphila]TVT21324.1 ATP-binding cassette domain-containing protein [Amycolatopsis acidiphila]UIJ63537.1 ATP-binding cassette domain-containing protein [Amycolatopsis acidiphila]GHG68404.1 ABC transporter ATP-binding protein [Amycolatopsis acidiphila]
MTTPVLRASALRRRFAHPSGDVEVLRGLELSVHGGELVTVSGRSGSGKSALLALLGGFDSPDSGRVLLAGQPIDGAPPWHTCAVLPQALGLAQELTVAENVALPLRLRPGKDVVEDRVAQLLADLGVGQLADRYPGEVSFGQQQRVALARAVSGRPKVLLTDEPTAHLDAGSTPAVLRLLRRCAGEGVAVIVATHDDALHAIADRRVRLADGVLSAA